MTNPTNVAAGELYQSDMLLTDEQRTAMRERKAYYYLGSRWTELGGFPHVPYVFQDSVDRNDVRSAINHWEDNTCLTFGETSNTNQPHIQFHIGSGCWSYIGMISSWNGQQISIGSGCNGLGTIVHEIGHAIGFYHEQSRSDRDDHVVILSENIQSGYEGNFNKGYDNNYGVPYDYSSNMHYGMSYFSKDGNPTIATKDPMAQELIGSRNGLTHRDKLLANRMYGCIGKWIEACPGLSSDPCLNDGYTQADCTCACPPGTSGSNCETLTDDYYADLRSPNSEIITTETMIDVYVQLTAGESFVKWIIPPTCKRAKIVFTYGDMYPSCYYQSLNVKLSPTDYAGEQICASDVSGWRTFTSETGIIITLINYVYYGSPRSIWKANVIHEDIEGCSVPSTTTQTPTTTTTNNPPTTTTTTPTTTTPTTTTTTTTPTTTTPTTNNPPTTTPTTTTTTPKTITTTLTTTLTTPATTTNLTTTITPPTTTTPTTTTTTTTITPPTTNNPPTTTVAPPPKLGCSRRPRKRTMKKGSAITITSPGYPDRYSRNKIRCGWKLKAKWNTNLEINCDAFELKGRDFLRINRNIFQLDNVPTTTPAKWLGITFFSKRRVSGKGFTCVVRAV